MSLESARRVLRRRTMAAVAVAAASVLAACAGPSAANRSTSPVAVTTAPATSTPAASTSPAPTSSIFPAQANAPAHQYYVSIGDSYAAGAQPSTTGGVGRTTRNGFAYQAVKDAKAKGYAYTLVNFGCGGATSTSVLQTLGCDPALLGPGAPSYPEQTQAAAAEAFIAAHRAAIGLVTVSIGGNDITQCGAASDQVACVTSVMDTVSANLTKLLAGLRAAGGPDMRIVGTTYPDVFLGDALSDDPVLQHIAPVSVIAFRSLLNPRLKQAYEAVDGRFVDVTKATGGYGSLTDTTTLAPYGKIPVPVAQICRLTFFCQLKDIHPRTVGYALIARLVVATLPPR